MNEKTIVVEETYNAPVGRVWQALTDSREIKQWYFNIDGFKPEAGFEFQFYGGSEEQQYLHLCKIAEAVSEHKLSYSWRYEGYEGNTLVTFEMKNENGKTRLKLMHKGIESFPRDNPDFSRESCTTGWTYILKISLKKFLEENLGGI